MYVTLLAVGKDVLAGNQKGKKPGELTSSSHGPAKETRPVRARKPNPKYFGPNTNLDQMPKQEPRPLGLLATMQPTKLFSLPFRSRTKFIMTHDSRTTPG